MVTTLFSADPYNATGQSITVDSLYLELENLFEIERVRDRERKIGYSLHKGTETLVRDREKFEIEGVRDRESKNGTFSA